MENINNTYNNTHKTNKASKANKSSLSNSLSKSHESQTPQPPNKFKKFSLKPNLNNPKKQTIFWDLDDVVFNSTEVVVDIINKNFREPNHLSPRSIQDVKDWGYKSIYAPLTQNQVHEIFKSQQFWDSIQVKQDFLSLAKSGVLSHYNNVIVTAGVNETFTKKKALLQRTLEDNNLSYDKIFSDFFGITDIHNFDKSVVDMKDGIQIDDAYFNLIDTNARCKILLKNYMETVSNNSFGDYKEILDNLYEVNNFAEIHQILEFNYADFKL